MIDVTRKDHMIKRFKDLLKLKELSIIIFVAIILLLFSIFIDRFYSLKNFEIISRQISAVGIISLGMTLVIFSGGIDLSVGAILSFAINIGGMGIVANWPIWIVYPVILFLGVLLGLVNGVLVANLGVPAIIITLGTMNIFRGITMVITKGIYITPIPSSYEVIGQGFTPFIIFIVVLIVFIIINKKLRFGRNLLAIGGNETSALYSGVPVKQFKIRAYMISGLLSALAGLILVGKSGFVQPQAGMGYEMTAITAVMIGGTSIFGGSGTVIGTFFGSIFLGLILAGLTMIAVNPYWLGMIQGLLIIIAITLDSLRHFKNNR